MSASWAIDSEPIQARGIILKFLHIHPVPTFEPNYKVSNSGTEFKCGYLKKGCVHLSVQQVLFLGTIAGAIKKHCVECLILLPKQNDLRKRN